MTYFSAKTFILGPRSLSISSIRGPKHKPWVEQGNYVDTRTYNNYTYNYTRQLAKPESFVHLLQHTGEPDSSAYYGTIIKEYTLNYVPL